MGQIFGQNIPLKIIRNSLDSGKLHHAMLFYGPESVGKFDAGVNIAKSLNCLSEGTGYCDACENCRRINEFNFSDLVVLSNDDRMVNIRFLISVYENNKKIIYRELISNISLLLSRQKYMFLPHLEKKKQAYPDGIVISRKKLQDNVLPDVYKAFFDFKKNGDISYLDDSFLEQLEIVQNSLDRSFIPKKSIDTIMNICEKTPEQKRVIIIQNFDLFTFDIASSLLKILEEPPENNYFILITTNPDAVPKEVIVPLKSRCLELRFRPLALKTIRTIFEKKFSCKLGDAYTTDIKEIFSELTNESNEEREIIQAVFADILAKKDNNFAHIKQCIEKNINIHRLIKLLLVFFRDYIFYMENGAVINSSLYSGSRFKKEFDSLSAYDFSSFKRMLVRLDRYDHEFSMYNISLDAKFHTLFSFLRSVFR